MSSVTIKADGQKVWDILTQPGWVKRWQYGSDLITDWTPGNRIEFVAEWEGETFRQWGTVLQFEPPHRLAYNLFAPRPDLEDRPENYFTMKYILTESEDGTRLDIMQEDGRPDAVQEDPQGEENPVLHMLKQLAETN